MAYPSGLRVKKIGGAAASTASHPTGYRIGRRQSAGVEMILQPSHGRGQSDVRIEGQSRKISPRAHRPVLFDHLVGGRRWIRGSSQEASTLALLPFVVRYRPISNSNA